MEQADLPECTFLSCTKFFESVRIEVVTDKQYAVSKVAWIDNRLRACNVSKSPDVGDPKKVVNSIQLLLSTSKFISDLKLTFHFGQHIPMTVTLGDVAKWSLRPYGRLQEEFQRIIQGDAYVRMLDIGGRARSGVLNADSFRNKQVSVLDILPGEGVDVVSDAHLMSSILPHDSFDAVFSNAVFEHLVMPWKVAVEMNRVMRVGAVGLIVTHQTIGMHDMPWDYFRFSDTSWKGIFNKGAGFEILDTELGQYQYIIPLTYEAVFEHAEKTGGFLYSAVLVRKISDTTLDWPLSVKDVTNDMYPA